MGKTRTIKVNALARVEGEGAMRIKLRGDAVEAVEFKIYEPPRFFEALLRGRDFREAPDITARVCGICPVAYQMSACQAMEDVCGVSVDGPIRALRRLLYCGEWIESHVLHIYMLHAPDFLGYPSGVLMAREYPDIVRRGLRLKKVGNSIMALLGGREIHPINVRLGGFYRAPQAEVLTALAPELRWACDAAEETVRWVAGFCFPDFDGAYELVSLRGPGEYPFCEGHLMSNAGLNIPLASFLEHVEEHQVPHSTALHALLRGRGHYMVGPVARLSNNFDLLRPRAAGVAKEVGFAPPSANPFRSIVARALEVLQCCEEALALVEAYEPPAAPHVNITARAGVGHGCTEAPRGILYHRYEIDVAGVIQDARIVPPTSQNQATIEDDLRRFVAARTTLPKEELTCACEQAIRNYDPCISCATHFLTVDIDHG